MQFSKYHGLGNDFILIDNRQSDQPLVTPQEAVQMCDRHFGIGADGVIFVLPSQNHCDYTMRIFNSDGSEPEMCGNGIRCFAQFVTELEGKEEVGRTYPIQTLAGTITPTIKGEGMIRVDMGEPELTPAKIPTTLNQGGEKVVSESLNVAGKSYDVSCVSMGNPHCLVFVEKVADIELEKNWPFI